MQKSIPKTIFSLSVVCLIAITSWFSLLAKNSFLLQLSLSNLNIFAKTVSPAKLQDTTAKTANQAIAKAINAKTPNQVTTDNQQRKQADAISPSHINLIINQVRGNECCGVGNLETFAKQLQMLNEFNLPATFALRYDVITDPDYLQIISEMGAKTSPPASNQPPHPPSPPTSPSLPASDQPPHPSSQSTPPSPPANVSHQFVAFLEITPSLAKKANVIYQGTEDDWYEAQHVFLVGYNKLDRQKLIDTYMVEFKKQLGFYPTASVAWMIDAWSLQYLRQQYGIVLHQITREQFGVDSYSLYGGPAHQPYYPSANWALIPNKQNPEIASQKMPLIVRQTITDPVWNYGDPESCHTSQPNDFTLCSYPFSYFEQLFYQAHQQNLNAKTNAHTFTLIGLENSMDEAHQKLFEQQLRLVANWQQEAGNASLTAGSYAQNFAKQNASWPHVYHGKNYLDAMSNTQPNEAWWITTPSYRVRLRQEGQQLYITDIRLYADNLLDPYLNAPAKSMGWWVVPFVFDGSRYWQNQANDQLTSYYDMLNQRPSNYPPPVLLEVSKQAQQLQVQNINGQIVFSVKTSSKENLETNKTTSKNNQQTIVAVFAKNHFALPKNALAYLDNPHLNEILNKFAWQKEGSTVWQLQTLDQTYSGKWFNFDEDWQNQQIQQLITYQGKITWPNPTDLFDLFAPQLFPQLTQKQLDAQKTSLYRNNTHALAGRNPVRLVLFPKDNYGQAVRLDKNPEVSSQSVLDGISIKRQHGHNGMIFIDFENTKPSKSTITIKAQEFSETLNIYFAPDCKQQLAYCLTHPQQALWYLQTKLSDWQRAKWERK